MKVIAELTGGFGNQLFAYACAYALAQKNHADLYINTYMADNGMSRELGIDKLEITYAKRITYKYKRDILNRAVFNKIRRQKAIGWGTKIVKEKGNFIYHPEIFEQKQDVMLSGYWQTDKYFAEYVEDLRKLFRPKKLSVPAEQLIGKIHSMEHTVAVHIRRGDYLTEGTPLKMEYFEEAMKIMEEKIGFANYCFFSDDIEWVKDNFGQKENYHFCSGIEGIDYIDEFFCMVECEHDITANSTFSWWPAYLNANPDKIVTAPLVSFWRGDFYPESWIKIETHIISKAAEQNTGDSNGK